MPRSFSVGAKVFNGQDIYFAGLEELRHIEIVGAIGSGDSFGIGNSMTVQPDLGAIVDAAEMQPGVLFLLRGGQAL